MVSLSFPSSYGLPPAMDETGIFSVGAFVIIALISYFAVARRRTPARPRGATDGFPLPDQVRHFIRLSDGRSFSYYTFSQGEDDDAAPAAESAGLEERGPARFRRHPVLYLHGFPSCGREGVVCAARVAEAGGELFAPDRPGSGHADPLVEDGDPDFRLEAYVRDLWEFVRRGGWDSFSVVGVSGGGPYALALLTSYLETRGGNADGPAGPAPPPPAEIRTVSIVAGVCCSAGVDGMMPSNQSLHRAASACPSSRWARAQLYLIFAVPGVLLKVLPASLMLKMIPKEIPPVDYDIMTHEPFGTFMVGVLRDALRQGGRTAALEAETLFRGHPAAFEETLKKHCPRQDTKTASHLPPVAIYQGMLDKNVAPSHSEYVHNELLGGASKLMTFDDLGHMSLVIKKAADYARFATTGKVG